MILFSHPIEREWTNCVQFSSVFLRGHLARTYTYLREANHVYDS